MTKLVKISGHNEEGKSGNPEYIAEKSGLELFIEVMEKLQKKTSGNLSKRKAFGILHK